MDAGGVGVQGLGESGSTGQLPGEAYQQQQVANGEESGAADSPGAGNKGGNLYQEKFGGIFNPDGTFGGSARESLAELGYSTTEIDKIARHGGIDGVLASWVEAQRHIEKREGQGAKLIPDPANVEKFNQWRTENGIPLDPLAKEGGYNFSAGLEEGASLILSEDALSEVGKKLHEANFSKEQADALIGDVNKALAAHASSQKEAFAADNAERENASYKGFLDKHGGVGSPTAELADKELGVAADTLGLDYSDPHDRAALTNPKVMDLLYDYAQLTQLTAGTPDSGGNAAHQSPQERIEQIYRENRNADSNPKLKAELEALARKQSRLNSRR